MKRYLVPLFLALTLSACEPEGAPDVMAQGKVTGQTCEMINAGRFGGLQEGNCIAVIDIGEKKPMVYRTTRKYSEYLGKEVIVVRASKHTFRLVPVETAP
uniref:Lipoprotein n=1 Tax=Pseudomonas phage RVTF4 TaxID=3236931 RepID=A0AB39CCJ0_9VIRU